VLDEIFETEKMKIACQLVGRPIEKKLFRCTVGKEKKEKGKI